jgi:putative ABC transport system permease protein
LSGLADSFHAEVAGTVDGVGASSWIMAPAAGGRLTAFAAFPAAAAKAVERAPGVRRASPVLFVTGQVVLIPGVQKPQTVNLMGVEPGELGDPVVTSGHGIAGPGQVVVDPRLDTPVGSALRLGGRGYAVVGLVDGRTMDGGVPNVYMTLASAQRAVTGGKPLITAVATEGTPTSVPAGLVVLSSSEVIDDTVAGLGSVVSSIDNTRSLMWIIAVAIVASMLYVAALERKRDFAVLKALGSSSSALFFSLVLEAIVVTLCAAILAEVLSTFLGLLFAQPIDITLDARLVLPLIAVAVGVLASVSALRRVTGADPATAFG